MSECVTSIIGDAPVVQTGEGGSNPTVTLFHKEHWRVAQISLCAAQEFTRKHHYSKGGSNTRVLCTGLFPIGYFWEREVVGITWWIPPTKEAAKHADDSMRFLDRKRWPVLLSYSDDWQGHKGTIYKAAGWTFAGKTAPERCYVKDGRMRSRKAGNRTKTHAEMLAIGCVCVGSFSKSRWIHRA